MKSKHHSRRNGRANQRGFAVIIILALLTVMTAFALHNSKTLHHLEQELKLIESTQQGKYKAR
mgnify:CR=1 FL=1